MVFSLTWLPEVLEAAGLKVAEQPGWRTRGLGDVGRTRGVICHHTAGGKTGVMPSLGVITNGRPGLRGPLAQLGLGRDGTYFVVAAGFAQHAGPGVWQGIRSGNTSFIGIEAENTGLSDDPWPDVQMDAYRRGVAAILARIGAGAEMCCGHKEFALPLGRKPDPSFDMADFRRDVAAILRGEGETRPIIPPAEPAGAGRPTLRRGDRGDLVKQLQTRLEIEADGDFGPNTEAAVRAFQRTHDLVPDGIVGPQSWAALDG
jgi:Putative peptidoglycan binding domain/N-acetylmuramoyl-L-alanine amidase